MAMAAVAAGAHGLMIEVHNDPANALCDGAQSLTPEQFAEVSEKVRKIREVVMS
jgi:3-deoxy-7-phosphoheptulonate synthase